MTCSLVLPWWLASEIEVAARDPLETAGVLICTLVKPSQGAWKLLARKIMWVPEEAYLARHEDALTIASDGYVPALREAEALASCAIWMHTHPAQIGVPLPSPHDDIVDGQLADLFRLRTGSAVYGSLIVSPTKHGISFSGFLQSEKARIEIDSLFAVGDRFMYVDNYRVRAPATTGEFDRSVRAFGGAVQTAVSKLRFAVVGNGGTGSAVAEQLVRLGARRLLLIDPDVLSTSNLTRVYGSTRADVGRPKTEVLRDHLKRIAPGLDCDINTSTILEQATARSLAGCDVVFGCTDDNAGRLVLSRLASYFLVPVFDCGVLLSSSPDSALIGIDGRVTTLCPGTACLVCRQRIDLRRAAAEQMSAAERERLAGEGYAPALGQVEPAVVAFTTLVAAAAVTELIDRFTGFGADPRPSEVLWRVHDRHISTNIVQPQPGHYCDPAANRLGSGVTEPFLEQAWL